MARLRTGDQVYSTCSFSRAVCTRPKTPTLVAPLSDDGIGDACVRIGIPDWLAVIVSL